MKTHIRKGVVILTYFKENGAPNSLYYLIVKQKNGAWSLPSGGIEENETEEEAAKRELYEETGIKDKELKSTEYINIFSYDKFTKGRQRIFLCEYTGFIIPGTVFADEILETKWVTKNEISQYLTRPGQVAIFMEACEAITA